MNASPSGTTTISENWEPIASASDTPSKVIRRQFHSTTSRGAYSVCATAMLVKIAPKAPQAAPVSGSANHTDAARMIPGEKQYSVSAIYPPSFPKRRRATYHTEAPSITPKNRNGARASHPQYHSDSD